METKRQLVVLMPYGEEPASSQKKLAPRLDTVRGKTIGIINNTWNCMNVATDELRRLLVSEYGAAEVIEKQTPATIPLRAVDMDDLAKRADAVICGIGN
ncbi:MAG: hypothetical protein Q7T26_01210 [Dehalococcoidia bacterium]|nr:hypothetical protein [Dehalococcoidia bacterium]